MKYIILNFAFLLSLGVIAQPMTNSPTPPARDAGDLISIYSSEYSNITGINYDPNWGQSGHMMVNPSYVLPTGDTILAYPNFNYQGTEFPVQVASDMEFLHIDIWVAAGTDRQVKVSPIDNSGVGPNEVLVEVPLTPGAWNSVDIPMSDFVDMSWNSIIQLKFDGQFNGDGTQNTTPFDLYLDNIYFWKTSVDSTTDATLSDLQLDGSTISGFMPNIFTYNVDLPFGTTMAPVVSATTSNANATATINQVSSLPGSATVDVTAEDGTTMQTYTINFNVLNSGPQDAPANPTTNPANVVSIYGDAYTNISGINYDPFWGQSGHMMVNPSYVVPTGDTILAYPNFNYQGTDFTGNPQDLSSMEFLHVDIWVPAGTDRIVKVSPIDNSGVGPGEVLVDVPTTPGAWNSVDLPISDFTDMSWQSVFQLKFDGQFNGDGSANTDPFDVYLDNVYFWREGNDTMADATLSDLQVDGNTVDGFASNVFDYTVTLPEGTTTIPTVSATATDMMATVMVTQASMLPGAATVDVTGVDGTTMQTYTVNFELEVAASGPQDAPANPTRNAQDVVSIYGDAYTNISGIDYDPNWGQSGHMMVNTDYVVPTGDTILAYPNFNYQGTDFSGNPQDLSSMEFLHVDIWVPAGTDRIVKVSPIDNSGVGPGEVLVDVPTTPGAWNSVDLPISDFTDMSWQSVFQLKFDGQFNGDGSANTDPFDVYLDNIYFWRMPSSVNEQQVTKIEVSPNPVKVGDQLRFSVVVDQAILLDLQGKIIQQANQTNTLNIQSTSAGLYIIQLHKDGAIENQKMIIK